MGKTTKIVLGVVGTIALFGGLCFVGIVMLAKKGQRELEGFARDSEQQAAEARTWATQHAQGECMNEGLRRMGTCNGFRCQIQVQSFTMVCLSRAAPTAGLCDGIPAPQDFMATSQWVNSRCVDPTPDQATKCRNLMSVLQRHCVIQAMPASPSLAAPVGSAAPSVAPSGAPTP